MEQNKDTTTLYEILGIAEGANQNDVKKAFRALALKFHPDKLANASGEDQQKASENFRRLATAYEVLSDPDKRKAYDLTGDTGEHTDFTNWDYNKWDSYFKSIWGGLVNEESIEQYKKQYVYSDIEKEDIVSAYSTCKGDLLMMLDCISFATSEDIPRITNIVKKLIKEKKVKRFNKFAAGVDPAALEKRRKQEAREAAKAERLKSRLKKSRAVAGPASSMMSLKESIRSAQADRLQSVISAIEEKYTSEPRSTKRRSTGSSRSRKVHPSEGS